MDIWLEEYGGVVIGILAAVVMIGLLIGVFGNGGTLYEVIERVNASVN